MTTILWWLLQNTITIAVLTAVVVMLCSPMSKRPALQHAVWLVVLVKFITPPVIVWPWSARSVAEWLHLAELNGQPRVFDDRGWPGSRELGVADRPGDKSGSLQSRDAALLNGSEMLSQPPSPVLGDGPRSDVLGADADILERLESRTQAREAEGAVAPDAGGVQLAGRSGVVMDTPPVGARRKMSFEPVEATHRSFVERWRLDLAPPLVLAVWVMGGFVFGFAQCRRIVRHWQLVRRATTPPPHLTTEVRRLSKVMGVRPVPVLLARAIASPFVWCVGGLRLLWPEQLAGQVEVSRCRGVIAHELAHVRRRDHWVAWLELLASVVWWWNPLFWYVRRRLRETAEIACDAVALSVLPDGRRQYAEAFLELSSIGESYVPVPILSMSTGSHRPFERRLRMILSESVISKVSLRGLMAVGMLAVVTVPSWSLGQAPSPGGADPAPASSDTPPTRTSATLSDRSKSLENRLEQLNAVDEALDAERAERAKKDRATKEFLQDTRPQAVATAAELVQKGGVTTSSGNASEPPAQRGSDSLESRVQKLEGKLDAILQELQKLRAAADPGLRGPSGGDSRSLPQNRRGTRDAELPKATDVRAESPDGKLVAVVEDGNILLVDQVTRNPLFKIDVGLGENQKVTSLAFRRDGKFLTVQTANTAIELDVVLGKIVRTLETRNLPRIAVTGDKGSGGNVLPESTNVVRHFPLKYQPAHQVQSMLEKLEIPNTKIVAIPATNCIIVHAPAKELRIIEALISETDQPGNTEATPPKGDSSVEPPGTAAASTQDGSVTAPRVAPGSQIDLVSLGTSAIEARGALRLAQAQDARLKKIGSGAAISQEVIEAAEINLETARQKVELLTRIARSVSDSAKADLQAAQATVEHSQRMFAKGYMTRSQLEQTKARILGAETNLKLIESILNPTTPPQPDRKANTP